MGRFGSARGSAAAAPLRRQLARCTKAPWPGQAWAHQGLACRNGHVVLVCDVRVQPGEASHFLGSLFSVFYFILPSCPGAHAVRVRGGGLPAQPACRQDTRRRCPGRAGRAGETLGQAPTPTTRLDAGGKECWTALASEAYGLRPRPIPGSSALVFQAAGRRPQGGSVVEAPAESGCEPRPGRRVRNIIKADMRELRKEREREGAAAGSTPRTSRGTRGVE